MIYQQNYIILKHAFHVRKEEHGLYVNIH